MRSYSWQQWSICIIYSFVYNCAGWIGSDREQRVGGIAISMSALGFYEIVTERCLLQFSCVNSNYFAPSEELSCHLQQSSRIHGQSAEKNGVGR